MLDRWYIGVYTVSGDFVNAHYNNAIFLAISIATTYSLSKNLVSDHYFYGAPISYFFNGSWIMGSSA